MQASTALRKAVPAAPIRSTSAATTKSVQQSRGEGVNPMAYNPEKTNANTSGEKQPKQQPDRDKVVRGVGSIAVNGPKK